MAPSKAGVDQPQQDKITSMTIKPSMVNHVSGLSATVAQRRQRRPCDLVNPNTPYQAPRQTCSRMSMAFVVHISWPHRMVTRAATTRLCLVRPKSCLIRERRLMILKTKITFGFSMRDQRISRWATLPRATVRRTRRTLGLELSLTHPRLGNSITPPRLRHSLTQPRLKHSLTQPRLERNIF
jgi:hypothetical protein